MATAAAVSASASEFFARLDQAGIMIRQRHSTRNSGQVTGYAVAMPGDVGKDGNPVWYSGGKLAADLTWPKLTQRWHPARQSPDIGLTAAERAITCGWMITEADEAAIAAVPEDTWKPGARQYGSAEEDKDAAEITGLMSRAGNWPDGLRWIARRVKPSRRHLRNLTDYEKRTGWKYSITCTNIPDTGISGVPGSHHPQFIDALHRDHATVETGGVRTAKAMGLRNLPSKTWQVNKGWILAANIAADLTAWARLPGLHDQPDLRDADPDTLRYRVWHLPARLVRHARQRILKISPDWPWKDAFLTCWQRLCALPAPA